MGCTEAKVIDPSIEVKVVFVVGGPGCGKGTQCNKIKSEFGYEHLSTGDILREIVKKEEHPKWKELDEKMKNGQFCSSAELIGFVKEAFKAFGGKKVLLDGFPRNKENITEWNKQLNDVATVKAVLYFECPADIMKQRMLGRNEGRADDNEATMIKRIENFEKETMPLLSGYDKEGKMIKIDATKSPDEVFDEVKTKFTEMKLS